MLPCRMLINDNDQYTLPTNQLLHCDFTSELTDVYSHRLTLNEFQLHEKVQNESQNYFIACLLVCKYCLILFNVLLFSNEMHLFIKGTLGVFTKVIHRKEIL